jgi:Ser/Thr protein kinase RdoA (MazF antagonist)
MTLSPAPCPVSASILSATYLAGLLQHTYDLGRAVTCRLWSGGVNEVYMVDSERGRHVLKVYRAGWRGRSAILYEAELLLHLYREGVAVSYPLADRAGSLVLALQAPEGERQAVLFSHAPGTHFAIPFYSDERECYLLGGTLADVHAHLSGFSSLYERPNLDLDFLLTTPMQRVQPFLRAQPEHWDYLRQLADHLRTYVDAQAAAGLEWGICHGDVHAGNAFIAQPDTVTLFDFDACGLGWRAYDLASMRHNTLGNDAAWTGFLAGYQARRPIAERDLAAVPAFVALRQYVLMGLRASFVTNNWSDSWWLQKAPVPFFDEILAFLREWERLHLLGRPAG